MEDKVNHNLRVGDVFLEPDGWARVLSRASMGCDICVWMYLKEHTMCLTGDYGALTDMKIKSDWQFLYNVCDLFADAKKALNEDTDT